MTVTSKLIYLGALILAFGIIAVAYSGQFFDYVVVVGAVVLAFGVIIREVRLWLKAWEKADEKN